MKKLLVCSFMLLSLLVFSMESSASSTTSINTKSSQVNPSNEVSKYTFTLFSFFDSVVSTRADSTATPPRQTDSQPAEGNR